MKKIEINIPGKTYNIIVGEGAIDSFPRLLNTHKLFKNIFYIVDKRVLSLHRDRLTKVFSASESKSFLYEFDSSETNKSFDGAKGIFSELINNGFARDTLIVAIGGGITGDLGGFVASTFMRGVHFVQIPTTLLSAVDSSVGGKTGINFEATKNIIGTFFQPEFVLIDTNFLKTLPEEELVCGVGEILKYAFLSDEKMFESLSKNLNKLLSLDPVYTKKIIETCVRFKGDVVAKDEKESGLRKILNLGHTFAHAFEVEQNYSIKHGQAVTVGIACALELSLGLGLLTQEKYYSFITLPLRLKEKVSLKHCDTNKIYEIMKRDKKGTNSQIKFVLLNDFGKLLIDVVADETRVKASIEKGVSYFIK